MDSSPFLPGTAIQYAWDSTSLGWLKECPRKYQYSMILGYRTKSDSVHLDFGRWYHNGLEQFDKLRALGHDYEESLRQVVASALRLTWTYPDDADTTGDPGKPWNSDHPNKTRETLIRSLIWYIDHFKDDPAQTVILDNGLPAVELSFKMELEWGPDENGQLETKDQPYLLCGHLDRVVNFAGGTYVMDRKTSSSTISNNYFDQYDPDNQMSLYTMAAKVIYKTPVKGVIIDAVQIAVGFSRFSRGFTYRTDSQIEEWLNDTKHWFELAESYATEGYWPMNDKSCHKYGGCPFRKVCSKSPEVRQKFLDSDFTISPWNPLVPR
jgi:hypothetical protein